MSVICLLTSNAGGAGTGDGKAEGVGVVGEPACASLWDPSSSSQRRRALSASISSRFISSWSWASRTRALSLISDWIRARRTFSSESELPGKRGSYFGRVTGVIGDNTSLPLQELTRPRSSNASISRFWRSRFKNWFGLFQFLPQCQIA